MFTTLSPSPDLQNALRALPTSLREEVDRVFSEYARLKHVALVEHEALCGMLDTLHLRLDDLPRDPTEARAVAIRLTGRSIEGFVLSNDTGIAPEPG